ASAGASAGGFGGAASSSAMRSSASFSILSRSMASASWAVFGTGFSAASAEGPKASAPAMANPPVASAVVIMRFGRFDLDIFSVPFLGSGVDFLNPREFGLELLDPLLQLWTDKLFAVQIEHALNLFHDPWRLRGLVDGRLAGIRRARSALLRFGVGSLGLDVEGERSLLEFLLDQVTLERGLTDRIPEPLGDLRVRLEVGLHTLARRRLLQDLGTGQVDEMPHLRRGHHLHAVLVRPGMPVVVLQQNERNLLAGRGLRLCQQRGQLGVVRGHVVGEVLGVGGILLVD